MKRFVRLKEREPHSDITSAPTDQYIKNCNGTLTKAAVRIRADADGYVISGRLVPEDARPVIFMGGSFVECFFVQEDRRVASILEGLWQADGQNVKVLNAGVSGATLLHAINSLLCKGLALSPAAVIYASNGMDFTAARRPKTFWSKHPFLRTVVTAQDAGHDPAAEEAWRPEPDWEERNRLLDVMVAITNTYSIPFWLVTAPQDKTYQLNDLTVSSNAAIKRYCANRGVNLVDLNAEIEDYSELLYDGVHLNETGTPVVAEILRKGISL